MKNVKQINILGASNEELMRISKQGVLSLTLEEMLAIKQYFHKQKRNPSDIELETIAQTWSEHCVHKTFKGIIEYSENNKTKIIDNLLKETIAKATKELNKKWCISVFKDNAGIIEFDKKNAVAFKIETHNHPSALEPYGGAGTGIGGVIRDILGVGLGAKPILNTDVFCFGPPNLPYNKLPEGVLHPKRICKGVVSGVRDYGNRMGIPTVNGAVIFDQGYICNPLVYCGTAGIMPRNKCFGKILPGDLIVVIGGKTGRDGIHGATFSSAELAKDTEISAVQIGNPIVEKKVTDVMLEARDKNLYRAVTDCGAGGLSSAIGEMGKETGARVDLEKAPLKYAGLTPWEIWVSEAQERMVLAVPPKNLSKIMQIFKAENVEATVLGKFTNNKNLLLFYENKLICKIEMDFLHDGVPRLKKKAEWSEPSLEEPEFTQPKDLTLSLKKILAHPNVASKEWIIRQYDHEVQAQTVLKPLQGIENDGPGDASAVKPLFDSDKGIVVANGINSRYGLINPYWMAASVIDEAIRNNVACGGNIMQMALLDNFCWGSADKKDQLAGLVKAAQACYDFAKAYQTPFISGKDSFNNEYIDYDTGKKISIPPTLLVSSISVIPNIKKIVSMDLKCPGNFIYIIGQTYNELGGSIYYANNGYIGKNVPKLEPRTALKSYKAIQGAIQKNLLASCHDCSEGGIGVALAEMAFAGGYGAEIELNQVKFKTEKKNLRNDKILFSESNSRFIVEITPKKQQVFEKIMKVKKICFACIGKVKKDKKFIINGLGGKKIVNTNIDELKKIWQKTLKW